MEPNTNTITNSTSAFDFTKVDISKVMSQFDTYKPISKYYSKMQEFKPINKL